MLPTLTHDARFSSDDSQPPGTALALRRTDSGVYRLPQVRTNWIGTNVEQAEAGAAELSAIAADVANAVEQATLQYRENNSWVQLELDLWRAVTTTVEKWRRRTPAPAVLPRPTTSRQDPAGSVLGPVRFQLRHR